MLALLLREVSPRHLTSDAVAALADVVAAVYTPALATRLLSTLLLDLRLWVYAPAPVQLSLLQTLLGVASRDTALVRAAIPVAHVVDAAILFYWEDATAASAWRGGAEAPGLAPRRHRVTREVVGERPVGKPLRELRTTLLELIKCYTRDGILLDETYAVIRAIRDCGDAAVVDDLVDVLLVLAMRPVPDFAAALTTLGGIEMMTILLRKVRFVGTCALGENGHCRARTVRYDGMGALGLGPLACESRATDGAVHSGVPRAEATAHQRCAPQVHVWPFPRIVATPVSCS